MAGHGVRAIELSTFIQGVLPFLQPANVAKPRPRACQCACWGRQPLGPGRCREPKSLAWYLASDERATAGSKDVAEAYLVGALGLAWMQEGRSRPGFLRAMGQDSLAARVTARLPAGQRTGAVQRHRARPAADLVRAWPPPHAPWWRRG
jgi:hypothetical protein